MLGKYLHILFKKEKVANMEENGEDIKAEIEFFVMEGFYLIYNFFLNLIF